MSDFLLDFKTIVESADGFRSPAFSMTTKSTPPPPLHSEKDYEQGGLFQVSVCL